MYNDDLYINRLSDGDLSALEVIFRRYHRDLYLYAYRLAENEMIAEDLVQDTFIKLWENRKSMPACRSLRPYLIKTVFNAFMDLKRHDKVKVKHQNQIARKVPTLSYSGTDDIVAFNDLNEHLRLALEKLPTKQRQTFMMVRIQGMKRKEVAEKMGVSIKTVEGNLTSALKKLKKEMAPFHLSVIFLVLLY
ncbi:DNA-directed RNA polymerase sigma-70 factor (plasmid) [Fulvitalea axinellae]|uniref:DNA-directed RNA polymerase sigma-70 factor n=1 Tax=Fulvitalea axinellae TaxID=1182444 RepID=A0AAU9CYZ3_9BACT|nr:DNA-directed RNA polymerase sigma-70 factor [Fulvitalea axinellae]